jgi:hydrogenase expression/formation protein HypC
MCLAIPGKLLSTSSPVPGSRNGRVSFGGIVKEVNLDYVPEAEVGDFVLVHVGFALSRIDPEEARQVFEYLKEIDELAELESSSETRPSSTAGSVTGIP